MPAPRVHVHQKYRSQPIDLQPYGNTISVEAESDNPFEDDRDVEVYTQASGGMAGPDPRVRSRGLLTQRPRGTRHQGGKVRAFQVTQDAAHPGFMPGMGDLSTPRGQKHAVRRLARDPGFVPGMGADPVATTPAPTGSPTWLQAIQAAGTTAGGITGSIYGAKTSAAQAETAAAMARAEQARADQMRSQAMLTNMGAHPLITYGALAVAALAVGYIVLKKKRK